MRICDNMPSIKHVLCTTSLSKIAIDMFRLRYHHFEQPNVEVKLTLSAPQTSMLANKNLHELFQWNPCQTNTSSIADFCSIITVCISQSPHHLLYGFEKYLSNRAVKLEHSPCWVETYRDKTSLKRVKKHTLFFPWYFWGLMICNVCEQKLKWRNRF